MKGDPGREPRAPSPASTAYGKEQPFSHLLHPPVALFVLHLCFQVLDQLARPCSHTCCGQITSLWQRVASKHYTLGPREVECFTVLLWLSLSLPACPRRGQSRRNSWGACIVSDNGSCNSSSDSMKQGWAMHHLWRSGSVQLGTHQQLDVCEMMGKCRGVACPELQLCFSGN